MIDHEKINSDHLSQLIDQQYYIQEQAELIKTLKVVSLDTYMNKDLDACKNYTP
jgi:hypothetical protein